MMKNSSKAYRESRTFLSKLLTPIQLETLGAYTIIFFKNPITNESVDPYTSSRSTFEFPSRVNLSGPSLYCIARTLGK